MSADPSAARIAALHLYPIKACAGLAVDTMRFDAHGPLDDRRWMLVDDANDFVTQREVPALALVRPLLDGTGLRVHAPGLPELRVAGQGGERRDAWCWNDHCAGFDEGAEAREWFTEAAGRPVRLLRFDPTRPRPASAHWVGEAAGRPGALTRFSDGFPLLVVSRASLAALNDRLAREGLPEATLRRFRPNVVVDGLDAFEEDLIETLSVGPDDGGTTLRIVKPCSRCTVTEVDPRTGVHASGVLQVLAAFRSDPRLDGAVTFGQNAIVAAGLDGALRTGDAVRIEHRWS